jgi:hypothetical protein
LQRWYILDAVITFDYSVGVGIGETVEDVFFGDLE